MQRAAAGDTQAFARIVRAHQQRVVRFAERMLGDAEAAEDVAQETFLRLWRGRARYQAQGSLTAFLLRVARNLCLDALRSTRSVENLDAVSERSASSPCPGKELQRQALAQAVRDAVQTLPEPQRAVFVLSHYEGLTYGDIAAILECPVGTVASRKRLAVETLRIRLRDWREGEATS